MTNTPMTFEEWAEENMHAIDDMAYAKEIWQASQAQQAQTIAELREQIQRLGEMANICTYNDLGKVCSYCNCKRKVKGK